MLIPVARRVTHWRDRLLDAEESVSETVTRVETRMDGLDKQVAGPDKRVENIEMAPVTSATGKD